MKRENTLSHGGPRAVKGSEREERNQTYLVYGIPGKVLRGSNDVFIKTFAENSLVIRVTDMIKSN